MKRAVAALQPQEPVSRPRAARARSRAPTALPPAAANYTCPGGALSALPLECAPATTADLSFDVPCSAAFGWDATSLAALTGAAEAYVADSTGLAVASVAAGCAAAAAGRRRRAACGYCEDSSRGGFVRTADADDAYADTTLAQAVLADGTLVVRITFGGDVAPRRRGD